MAVELVVGRELDCRGFQAAVGCGYGLGGGAARRLDERESDGARKRGELTVWAGGDSRKRRSFSGEAWKTR